MPSVPLPSNNPGVTVGLISAAAAQVAIAFMRAKWGIDFAGQEGNLTILATGFGYWASGQKVTP